MLLGLSVCPIPYAEPRTPRFFCLLNAVISQQQRPENMFMKRKKFHCKQKREREGERRALRMRACNPAHSQTAHTCTDPLSRALKPLFLRFSAWNLEGLSFCMPVKPTGTFSYAVVEIFLRAQQQNNENGKVAQHVQQALVYKGVERAGQELGNTVK